MFCSVKIQWTIITASERGKFRAHIIGWQILLLAFLRQIFRPRFTRYMHNVPNVAFTLLSSKIAVLSNHHNYKNLQDSWSLHWYCLKHGMEQIGLEWKGKDFYAVKVTFSMKQLKKFKKFCFIE